MLESPLQSEGQLTQRIIERERFAVLLHLYTYGHFTADGIASDRIMKDLGLRQNRAEVLIRSLLGAEYLEHCRSGQGLVLTEKGREYIERHAGRRRSVRF
jgi:DNA-binding MarR family transcriptional regulator